MMGERAAAHDNRDLVDLSVIVYSGDVIRSFADQATEDLFDHANTRSARRFPRAVWPIIHRKLDALEAAVTLQDLRSPPGNRLERLKGERAGRWGIRVNDQFRITFAFENGAAVHVRCEDYH